MAVWAKSWAAAPSPSSTAHGVRFDNADNRMEGGIALTVSYLRVGIVGAGYAFKLRQRELETLVQMRSAPSPTEVLRGDSAAG